jgi:RimJ/RimL family protein N-acetyltransferase
MLRPRSEYDLAIFRRYAAEDRMEELTCRPVIDGKRMPDDTRHEDWTFVFEDRAAGWVSLFDFNARNRSAEFGYGVLRPLRGRGIGKRMLTEAFDHFFATTNLNKLHCQTASFNRPSVKLLEHLGLHRDAVLREHHELDGRLYDDYVFSVLRREWLERER